jgi:hypothetical protein
VFTQPGDKIDELIEAVMKMEGSYSPPDHHLRSMSGGNSLVHPLLSSLLLSNDALGAPSSLYSPCLLPVAVLGFMLAPLNCVLLVPALADPPDVPVPWQGRQVA